MSSVSLIAKASVKIEYLPTTEILEGIIEFEQREYGIYYIYSIRNKGGEALVAGRSNFISNKFLRKKIN